MAQSSQYVSRGPWRILIISIVLFVVSIVVFVGIEFGYIPYLINESESLDSELASLNQTFRGEAQEDVFNLFSQIYNVQALFNQEASLSSIPEFLEGITHASITLQEARVNFKDGNIALQGVAPSYDILVSQLNILGSEESIKSVVLERSEASQEGINFTINLKRIASAQ